MRIIIAGGGTGGHLFPAVALAETFRAQDPADDILFVGTKNALEISTLSEKEFDHMSIVVAGLRGRNLWQQVLSLAKIPKGFFQAIAIIWRFNPDIIVGVGGYASGPVALAARFMGKKVVIHEQNILPGFTNRILARIASRIFISFPDTLAIFKSSKTVITGNPVRREILLTKKTKKPNSRFKLLIVGGSQGAHAINRAITEALDYFQEPDQIDFVHQTGVNDLKWVADIYEHHGIDADVQPFFEDMASAYSCADLIVCRAGATTIAELTALGKPAIYIPFPFAVNNHQELNARYITNSSGGDLLLEKDLSGDLLARKIDKYFSNPEALHDMSARTAALGRPEAADYIVDECKRLLVLS